MIGNPRIPDLINRIESNEEIDWSKEASILSLLFVELGDQFVRETINEFFEQSGNTPPSEELE